jgi:hypothetical protein
VTLLLKKSVYRANVSRLLLEFSTCLSARDCGLLESTSAVAEFGDKRRIVSLRFKTLVGDDIVGAGVGIGVGLSVGIGVTMMGRLVGCAVGEAVVGLSVGRTTGYGLGCGEGLRDGEGDTLSVGEKVGAEVGHIQRGTSSCNVIDVFPPFTKTTTKPAIPPKVHATTNSKRKNHKNPRLPLFSVSAGSFDRKELSSSDG